MGRLTQVFPLIPRLGSPFFDAAVLTAAPQWQFTPRASATEVVKSALEDKYTKPRAHTHTHTNTHERSTYYRPNKMSRRANV